MTAEDLTNLNAASQAKWRDIIDLMRATVSADRVNWLTALRDATPDDLRAASDAKLDLVRWLACLAVTEAVFRGAQEDKESEAD